MSRPRLPASAASGAQVLGKFPEALELDESLLDREFQVLAQQGAIDIFLVCLDHWIAIEVRIRLMLSGKGLCVFFLLVQLVVHWVPSPATAWVHEDQLVLQRADAALYRAKSLGRDRVEIDGSSAVAARPIDVF